MASTLIAIVTVLAALGPGSESSAPCNESIRQQDLKADLFFLASDAFQGRLTGSAGNTLAAEFIASRFDRLGLKRMGKDESYFQPFLLSTATLGPSNKLEVIRYGAGPMRFRIGQDYVPLQISPSVELKTRLAFAGFGISAPERGHDDYRNADVRGVIVLVLAHEPGENDPQSPFDGLVLSEASNLLRKVLTAQEKGASGVLIMSDIHNHREPENFEAMALGLWPEKPPRIAQYTLQDWAERVRIPVAMISIGLARTLFGDAKGSFQEIARSSERPREVSLLPGEEVALTTDVSHHVVPDRNVVAALEGCDPKLKDEWVVISCHLDHNGAEGDRVYNGEDDNGSGCVGLLEIAEAYALAAQQGHRPKRSILFAAFNSEERGLLGAYAFVERPLMPLDRIVAVLNMDMIGRNEEVLAGGGPRFRGLPIQSAESNRNALNLLGHSYSPSLTRAIEQANASCGLTLKQNLDNNASNLLRRSDHWPFLQRGVPAVFIHTGLHPDYHTPADRPEKIEYAKMERIVRLVHQASWDLAQQPDRPGIKQRTTPDAAR